MREYILSEIKNMIAEAVNHEIPKLLDAKNYRAVKEDCELVLDLMMDYFSDTLVSDPHTGPSKNYYEFLKALGKVASSTTDNAKNANLVFQCLSAFYNNVFLVIPKPAQGK
ncbi:hypothetical protein ES703_81258 [subsurface metagenome]